MRTINFLGIGGHACGSTKLYQLLKAHPQIGFVYRSKERGVDIRGKECHYWDRYRDRPLDWYLRHFKWEFPCVGEITPAYARLDKSTVSDIHGTFPNIHVFFIVRDTLDRTWSNIRKNIVKMRIKEPTIDWMISQANDPKTVVRNDYVRTVRIWKELFGDNFHVIVFDEFIANTRRVMLKIAERLGVDTCVYDRLGQDILSMKTNPSLAIEMPGEFEKWFRNESRFDWELQLVQIKDLTALF